MSMKKGTKVLALFLALVTVFTGMSWDFSRAKAEGESTAAGTLADGKITFDNIDVKTLEEAGFTSTRFLTATGTAVAGEVDKSPSEHWFSGQSGYADGVSVTAKNDGLKPNTATEDDRYFLYTPYSYEDFKISTTIYYGAYAGVVFGEKNVYPTKDGTSGSVAVFFNSGRIHIMGAVDYSTAVITRGTKAAKSPNGTATGYAIFNNGAGDTIKGNAGTAYTLNVMKQGKHLTVWISGGSGVMTIDITDGYKTGWIGLQAKGYHSDCGGFQSLEVKKINAVESQQLDNVPMSDLDDMGYTASVGATLTKDSVADAFFSGKTNSAATITTKNDGVKALATGGSVSALNIPYVYENFRLEAEVYHGQLIGVAAGSATSYPRQAGMISVFYNIYNSKVMLQMEGAFQSSTLKRVGGIAGPNAYQFCPTENGSKIDGAKEQTFTIVLEVRNKVMTVWMEGYDGYVTASVADTYTTDKISLIARKPAADGGGFKSYTITNLDAGDAQNFDNVKLNNLDAAGYTATKYNGSGTVIGTENTVSSYWFSGQSGYADSASVIAKNDGLKPTTTGITTQHTTLNLPCVYDNFRIKATAYKGQVVGIAIGKENKGPWATSDSISVYFNGKYIELKGAVQLGSVNAEGGQEHSTTASQSMYHFVPKKDGVANGATEWGEERTIVVELQNGILSAWLEGYEGIVRFKVADSYTTGNIALFSRRYDDNGGGLKSYEIEKLPATSNIGTTVDLGGYTSFDRVDVAELEEAGFTAALYDRTSGEKITDADTKVSSHWFAGEVGKTETKVAVTSNDGLKAKTTVADGRMTVLNTPYTYEDFRISTEVYWGASTGIVLGARETFPVGATDAGIWIYFNANQIQISGAGIDLDSVVTTEGGKWNTNYAPTYIFKPHADYSVQSGQVYKLDVEMKAGVLTVWVDGYSGMLSAKVSEAFEGGMIGLAARQYDGDGGGLKSLTVEELNGDIVKSYTSEEFAAYRQADGYTVPAYKNYLFAGWYTSERCALEDAVSADTTAIESGEVYVKFVPRYVLSTKAQISANLINGDLTDDAVGSIRFCTTVDTLQYAQVGFDISYMKGSTNVTKTFASNQVYREIKAIGSITYQPTQFCNVSQYFKACTINNIGEDYYGAEFTVTPFWKTLDGTVVKGDTVVKSINQGRNRQYLSGKTALFVGDSIQAGNNFTGEGDLPIGWAQRMQRYGMVTENIAKKGWALTTTETSGRSQIVTQLETASKSAYDFVLLEGGVNDVRIDQDNANITIAYGEIKEADAAFDTTTIAGAMQDLIVKTQTKFPDATIVYIINHYFGATSENMAKYVQMVKEACRVHGITYVDLSDTDTYPSLEPLQKKSSAYIPDNLHPNAAGYELSTPVIADHLRMLVTGELVSTVYVSDTGTDQTGYGTVARPYRTLNYAIDAVADGGTVCITDSCTIDKENAWKAHGKTVTIRGTQENAASVLYGADDLPRLCINDGAYFTNMKLKLLSTTANSVHAEGNPVTIAEDVVVEGVKEIYGGSRFSEVQSTDLKLYAGTYEKIFGGSYEKKVLGDTHVTVGGSVNLGIADTTKWSNHEHVYMLYGAGDKGSVAGDTYVTVEEGASFIYVYGGGRSAGSEVSGSTNVVFSGNAMSVYGGSYQGTTAAASVKILGGTVQQVFGGCEDASMTGDVNISVLGGEVSRRIYGGCYNDFNGSWKTNYSVTGCIGVEIGGNANLSLNTDFDRGINAVSRYGSAIDGEYGILIFNDGTYDTYKNKIGSTYFSGNFQKYNYLVNAAARGKVSVQSGKLKVVPNEGYTATVAVENGAALEPDGDGMYTLPELETTASRKTVTVTFAAAQ